MTATGPTHFYPRPLRGGRPPALFHAGGVLDISIHALCEEGDVVGISVSSNQGISIHALCEEGDVVCIRAALIAPISIHALCEEGDRCVQLLNQRIEVISIHALCEEGDPRTTKQPLRPSNFYQRPLRGGRPAPSPMMRSSKPFLSTPSARRATAVILVKRHFRDNFYPRPLRGGRRACSK